MNEHTTRRARRMERRHKSRKPPALNLVSLMDIFTILVFFLLVTASNTQQLPSSKDIRLPTSVAKKVPDDTIVIAITAKDILVQGRRVASVDEVLRSGDDLIAGLQKELEFHADSRAPGAGGAGRAVTIMGDENLPYVLLRKVLASCRQANYTRIAFGATQKARDKT
jgi:biopolymer transport protein ExbD